MDGKNLNVLDLKNEFRKEIQIRNSGDSIFWIKNYSDTNYFEDRKTIEKMFGSEIESKYNDIVHEISEENPDINFSIKENIIQWLFFTKQRSPIWRNHLNNFINYSEFEKKLERFVETAVSMRWTIYKTKNDNNWITSDNPGFCLNIEDFLSQQKLSSIPIYDLNVDSILFYPLTKKYCLNIHPYDKGESLNLNLTNTPLNFETTSEKFLKLINYCTYINSSRLIISNDSSSIQNLEIKNKT
ncbi:DUF4238 domain-containing protein [Gramella lutea]|uniref:DUF4238 domain-containing protein n=1 Tax=Christiangramia lutea TaxID=1607951 RepID=A0A9X1V5Q7_9FLAO|nr:DUF4238 domain-containing protein [Christiangramia lutea]